MARKRSELPDQKARDQIATDLDRTLLVEAAAGTGKTTCLIERMIGLIREGKCRIETMAAVTFTRKAAAELRSRFQLALEREVRESSGEKQKALAEALNQVERCFIGTIHSLCGRLLRERPVEAGLDPAFVELDDDVDFQLRQQAWREYVATLIATDDAILTELERLGLKISPSTRRASTVADDLDQLGLEPAELGPGFLEYAKYPDVVDWPAAPVALPDLTPCINELDAYYRHVKSLSLPANTGNDKLMPKIGLLKRMIPRVDLKQPAQLMEVLEQFDVLESRAVVQKNWPGLKQQALAERDRWNKLAEEFAQPLLLKWREHRYEPVMRAIRPAREVYDGLRRERNGLNFQDLLLRSVTFLRDKPDVRRYFRKRFSHLLIDEFQDTDPIQAEVMLLLTADDDTVADWQQCRPVPGSLFVVGDPKQSIYRFRRADIVTYSKVRSIIEEAGGQVVSLSANFRSVKPILEWVNECFGKIFPTAADIHSPADRPLEAGRDDRAVSDPCLERLVVPSNYKRNDEISEYEADLIARTIRKAVDGKWSMPRSEAERRRGMPPHARPGDFLIVAKSKARLTVFGQKLQQYGLPHLVTGGRGLNDVPELELLHLCLSAAIRSDDPIALVAALRSSLFGVSDSLLYEFRRHGGRFNYRSEIPSTLQDADRAVLNDAFERLRFYSAYLHRMPMAAAIERIASDLGLMARACAAEEGNIHAGSLLKAIDLMRSVDSTTHNDYASAIARMVDGTRLHDGGVVRPFSELPVRVMNLHQCKGLESPVVFLVDPSGESEHDVSLYIDRKTNTPKGFLPIYGPKRSQWGPPPILAHPPGWHVLASEEQKFLDAETNRLLYVAATRAGVKLVISQRQDENADQQKNPWHVLAASMNEAGQLADPGKVGSKQPIELTFERDAWAKEAGAITDRWRSSSSPTYAVRAIKESAIKGGAKPHGAEKHGAEWGEVLHSLLEVAMKQPSADLQGLAISALEAAELPLSLVEDVTTTVQKVIGSDLWRRAQTSPACLTEVPMALRAEPSRESDGLPTVLRGVIDLVFRVAAGWVIVDYKSERVDESDVPALVEYYRPQVNAYADAWQKLFKEPVVERGLFFTHPCTFVVL